MKKLRSASILISLLLSLLMPLCLPVSATGTRTPHKDSANIPLSQNSGNCGPSTTWSYADGTLTISGDGKVETVQWSHHNENIQHVVINNGVTNIPACAFQYYPNLKTATIADSVTIIETSAFAHCSALTSIVLPKNLQTIGNSAFSFCSSLKEVTMGSKVTTLGDFAFSGTAITGIALPNSLIQIGVSVFNGCKQLKELHFPASLEKMGDYIISNCSALKTVYFNGDLPETTGMNYNGTYAVIYYPKGNTTWAAENLPFISGGCVLLPYSDCTEGHTYGGWVWIVEPTPDVSEGIKERICIICKQKETITVPVNTNTTQPPTTAPATQPATTAPATAPATTSPATQPATTSPATQPATTSPAISEPASVPTSEPAGAQQSQPTQTGASAPAPTPTDSTPSYKTAIIVVSIVMGVVIACGAAWYFLRKRQ